MAELFKNLASTTLSADIDDSAHVVGVASAMGFSGGNFRILVDSEIMKVTGVSGTTLTVVRGQEGTPATAHSNGAAVKHILTAGALDAHDQNDLAAYDTYANKPCCRHAGPHLLADRWHLPGARQRLDLGEVRPDLAHDASCGGGFPEVGEPGGRHYHR